MTAIRTAAADVARLFDRDAANARGAQRPSSSANPCAKPAPRARASVGDDAANPAEVLRELEIAIIAHVAAERDARARPTCVSTWTAFAIQPRFSIDVYETPISSSFTLPLLDGA
jgi:hypothetical protein